jgi:serine/threonine protein kinase
MTYCIFSKSADFSALRNKEKLGEGAFGKVFKYTTSDNQYVAIKRMISYQNGISYSALVEIHMLRVMDGCSNISQLLGVKLYTLMCGGVSCQLMMQCHTGDMTKFRETVPILECIKYSKIVVEQLLNGLYQMHIRGIIHRDIKPQNILMDYDYSHSENKLSGPPKCYIGDFGISCQLSCDKNKREKTKMYTDVYTAIYRSPEILSGNCDYTDKADIWALALTIVEYFTLIPVFNPIDYDVIYQIIKQLHHVPSSIYESKRELKMYKIHDYIDVECFIRRRIHCYNLIPDDILRLLPRMLQVNPADRAHISDLIQKYEICPHNLNIERKNIYRDTSIDQKERINLRHVCETINWVIDISEFFKLNIRTIIGSIDMIYRFIGNYSLRKSKLQLLAVSCISVMSKLNENSYPDSNLFSRATYPICPSREIEEMELLIAERLNYIFVSCDINDLVHKLKQLKKVELYPVMKKMISMLYKKYGDICAVPYITYIEILDSFHIDNEVIVIDDS